MQKRRIENERRFTTLLEQPDSGKEIYDQPLLERQDWVVAPTLGAIVPNWLIVVPRIYSINLNTWKYDTRLEPVNVVNDLASFLGLHLKDLIWFEHGPANSNSPIGCDSDYAHLHVIFEPLFVFEELLQLSMLSSNLKWEEIAPDHAYNKIPHGSSYLIAGTGSKATYALNVESAGSQFFRRRIASIVNKNNEWDYRLFPQIENIELTIRNFKIRRQEFGSCTSIELNCDAKKMGLHY